MVNLDPLSISLPLDLSELLLNPLSLDLALLTKERNRHWQPNNQHHAHDAYLAHSPRDLPPGHIPSVVQHAYYHTGEEDGLEGEEKASGGGLEDCLPGGDAGKAYWLVKLVVKPNAIFELV